jgi:hypothetical protein
VVDAQRAREREVARALVERVVPLVTTAVESARAAGEVGPAVWLIGSFALGEPTAASDVDLLVADDTACDPIALARRVEAATGLPVDVIPTSQADAQLLPLLIAHGLRL